MKKNMLILSAMFVSLLVIQGCAKASKETTTTTSTTTTTVTPAKSPVVAPSADSVGVPECDDYISKYERCINSKVPEMARGALKTAFDQTRASWKAAAATPEGKQGLAMGCKAAADASKQAVAAYGCEM